MISETTYLMRFFPIFAKSTGIFYYKLGSQL
jgi:hypothetical protein